MLYHYDGSFDGLMTAVYYAFYARIPIKQAHFLAPADTPGPGGATERVEPIPLWDNEAWAGTPQSSTTDQITNWKHPDIQEVMVTTDSTKAEKVIQALISQVGYDAYDYSYHVHLSCFPNRGDLIFQYIKLCFATGPKVFQMWAHPIAGEILRIARRVTRERQHLLGFLRFQELDSGALFAEISPTHNLLELMAPHFADRLSGENWLIYDSSRHIACVHRPGKGVLFTDQIPPELIAAKEHSAAEPGYQDLWRTFFKAIAIEGRYNPRCQMNMMPKKYWKHMTEMQSPESLQ